MHSILKIFDRNFLIFTFSFSAIFLTFGGAQQYLTTMFEILKNKEIAFMSLFLIYLFSFLFSPFSALIVSKFSPKKSLIFSSLFYIIFVAAVITKSEILIHVFSILLGIFSAVLWTACGTYIIKITKREHYGIASGLFNSVFSLMIILGMISMSFLLQIFYNENSRYEISYTLILIPGILGIIGLFNIKNVKSNNSIKQYNLKILIHQIFTSQYKLYNNKKLSKFFIVGATTGLLFSLTIGYLPLDISKNLGESYVGIFASLFYVAPVFLSLNVGLISDKIGRIKIFLILLLVIFIGLIMIEQKILLFGILMFAIGYSLIKTLFTPLVGDISNEKNLEDTNAFINTSLNLGVMIGLFLSLFIREEIYIISIIFVLISIFMLKFRRL